jgi:hypothetical protein
MPDKADRIEKACFDTIKDGKVRQRELHSIPTRLFQI